MIKSDMSEYGAKKEIQPPFDYVETCKKIKGILWNKIIYIKHKISYFIRSVFFLIEEFVQDIKFNKKLNQYKKSSHYYKISFCITSVNQLFYLKKTLLRNIKDNIKYPHVEFVVLDYNSNDGLEEWIKEKCKKYLDSGVLKYHKIIEQAHSNKTYAKNMSHKFATGDVLCNLDVDNYTNRGFAFYVNFSLNEDVDCIGLDLVDQSRDSGIQGFYNRFFLSKTNFEKLNGYNEESTEPGYPEVDLYKRARASGMKHASIPVYFLKAIKHEAVLCEKDITLFIQNSNETDPIYLPKKHINQKEYNKKYFKYVILNERYNFLYVPIPKVACSSFKKICRDISNIPENKKSNRIHDWDSYDYVFLEDIKKEKYKKYFKFAFVRNPWDRIVSCYIQKIRGLGALVPQKMTVFSEYDWFDLNMTFEEFVEAVSKTPDAVSDNHFCSQYCFLTDENDQFVFDFIGRFENFEQDSRYILDKLNLSHISVPKFNATNRKRYQDYYTEETKQLIAKRYAKDIELFGYTFE